MIEPRESLQYWGRTYMGRALDKIGGKSGYSSIEFECSVDFRLFQF